MKDKERLLSIDEPLRFIFSHSALREGWDNPNVFQICTLNETSSAVKKRQEIGRGLRLPVDQDGQRVFDDSINKLYVMANESYEDFARALQTEYEEDCGVTFGKVPLTALAKHHTRGRWRGTSPSARRPRRSFGRHSSTRRCWTADGTHPARFRSAKKGLHARVARRACRTWSRQSWTCWRRYQIERHIRKDTDEGPNRLKKEVTHQPGISGAVGPHQAQDDLPGRVRDRESGDARCGGHPKKMEKIEPPKIKVVAGRLDVRRGGVVAEAVSAADEKTTAAPRVVPDILAYLQNETELTRSTLVRILKASGRLPDVLHQPTALHGPDSLDLET